MALLRHADGRLECVVVGKIGSPPLAARMMRMDAGYYAYAYDDFFDCMFWGKPARRPNIAMHMRREARLQAARRRPLWKRFARSPALASPLMLTRSNFLIAYEARARPPPPCSRPNAPRETLSR